MKLKGVFLIYVRKYSMISRKDELYVYRVNTSDVFHTIGEMMYRSLEQISEIYFNECNSTRLEYWKSHGFNVLDWTDKYNL